MPKSTEILIKQLEVVKRMIKTDNPEIGRAVIDEAIKRLSTKAK